jgi:hypothetical protein
MERAEDATTNHGHERQWVAVLELQVDGKQHNNLPGQTRTRHNKRRTRKGGQAGRCGVDKSTGGRGSAKRYNAITSRLQGGVFDERANIDIIFAIGGRGISPVNPP